MKFAKPTYVAVASQHRGICEALNWAWISIEPFVLARGHDADRVLARGIRAAGHEDVHLEEFAP